jgi:hypothetical protein
MGMPAQRRHPTERTGDREAGRRWLDDGLVALAAGWGFVLAYLLVAPPVVPGNPRLFGTSFELRPEPFVLVLALAAGRRGLVGASAGVLAHNLLFRLGPEVSVPYSFVQTAVVLGSGWLALAVLDARPRWRPLLGPSILSVGLLTVLPVYAAWEFGTSAAAEAWHTFEEILVPVLLLGPLALVAVDRREAIGRRLRRPARLGFAFLLVGGLLFGPALGTAAARCFGVPEDVELGEGWRLDVNVTGTSGLRDGVTFGAIQGASAFVDPGVDEVRLTDPAEELRLYFLYKYPDTGFIRLRVSIDRPQPSLFWPLVLEYRNDTPQDFLLTWNASSVPAAWTLTIGTPGGERVDMGAVSSFLLPAATGIRSLRIDGSSPGPFPDGGGTVLTGSVEVLALAAAGYGALVALIFLLRWRRRRQ